MRKSRHCTSTGSVSLRSTERSRRSPNRKPLTARGQRRKDRAWAKRLQARPLFAHYAIDDDSEQPSTRIATPRHGNGPF